MQPRRANQGSAGMTLEDAAAREVIALGETPPETALRSPVHRQPLLPPDLCEGSPLTPSCTHHTLCVASAF